MTPTRTRMIDAAVDGLRRHGVAGMSFTEVLEASGAARGAIYHHFPGGKTQLVAEAASANAAEVRDGLVGLPAQTPAELVRAFLETVRPVMEAAVCGRGCAVAAVALGDDAPDGALRRVAQEGFSSWIDALAGRLLAAGVPSDEAADLATTLLIVLEGAQVLSRAAGSTEPFDRTEQTILSLVQSRYGRAANRSRSRRPPRDD